MTAKVIRFPTRDATPWIVVWSDGEDVKRMPHRRWWQVDAEHVARLRAKDPK